MDGCCDSQIDRAASGALPLHSCLQLPERSVRKVLDIIADTSENLRWKIEDGVVSFVTQEEMKGGQVLAFYEVRDIIHPVPNFPGREIIINPSGINVAQDIFGDEEKAVQHSPAAHESVSAELL